MNLSTLHDNTIAWLNDTFISRSLKLSKTTISNECDDGKTGALGRGLNSRTSTCVYYGNRYRRFKHLLP